MHLAAADLAALIALCRAEIDRHGAHLSALDSAIGDGDHGANMRRGLEAVFAERDSIARLPLPAALEKIGLVLVMNIGGAAGPLYGTLLMELGRGLAAQGCGEDFAAALERAVAAVARRGRSGPGDKTLLDVLYPVQAEIVRRSAPGHIAACARSAAQSTQAMQARRGRASFLGARSIGHEDPGASSCALLTAAICGYLAEHRPL
ncbi:dihydroxyacetone kinase subunit DhaL [Ancylobacter oerskovii]|uniref:Dihydroxyacetone kinase subunit DhaL n=1 Tax=Ancylobacter oerskovii TaxID=459519 RepID=A0ABW4YSP9_9HYPH|nr:dihydroxyacetone kinase subunit DhaL [Ancylobacter oerskovii]MBS7543481.1 dihydroxyacetone kinase subunit L [Ancylobacter oerskovii]